jgi:hypothetical protein
MEGWILSIYKALIVFGFCLSSIVVERTCRASLPSIHISSILFLLFSSPSVRSFTQIDQDMKSRKR